MDQIVESTTLLSQNEKHKLSFNYWFDLYVGTSQASSTIENAKRILDCCLPHIQRAYLSIKESGNISISDILDDQVYVYTIFHIARSICMVNEFLQLVKLVNSTLSPESEAIPVQAESSSCPLHEFVGGPSSSKFHNLLLIVKEILTQIGIRPNVSEIKPRNSELLNEQSAFLIEFIELGVKQLRTYLRQSESQMLVTMNNCFATYKPDSYEFNMCCGFAERLYNYTTRVGLDMRCLCWMSDPRFQMIIRLLDPYVDPLTGEKDFYFQKHMRRLEKMVKRTN